MVPFLDPALMSNTESVVLPPTATWPNERLEGEATSPSLATPEPVTCNWRFGFPVLLKVTVPAVLPSAVGANVTLRLILPPAARSTGRVTPETLNSDPVTLMVEIVRSVWPVFVKTTS
jgi:hypothetical protein